MSSTARSSNRREFLNRSLMGVAGTAVVGGALRPAWASAVHSGGTETIRIGLIGCGGRGTGAVVDSLRADENVELVAVADVFQDRVTRSVEAIQREFPQRVKVAPEQQFVGFNAYKDLLASPVDLVILTTPPGFRPLHFEAAVAAGKNIFMEKPVAVDAAGVRRVLAANQIAKQKSLIVQVGLQRRHERLYREVIGKIQDGAIGDLVLMRAYWNGDGVWVRPRQEQQTELEYQMANWYYFNWLCGDHIVEQHIHNLDVINWLKGSYPVSAQGQGGREVRDGKDFGQIYDHHMVEFTYADGSKMFSQCRHIGGCWNSVSEHAHGSSGRADISGGILYDGKGKEIFRSALERDGWQQEHRDMYADYRNGVVPNEGDYGALSTMTAIFGRMATYSGAEIAWDKAIALDDQLADVDALSSFDDPAPVQPDENGNYPIPKPGNDIGRQARRPAATEPRNSNEPPAAPESPAAPELAAAVVPSAAPDDSPLASACQPCAPTCGCRSSKRFPGRAGRVGRWR
jgi:predicted dehydrogenase